MTTTLKGNNPLSINGQPVHVSAELNGHSVNFAFSGALQGNATATLDRTVDIKVGDVGLRVKAYRRNGVLVADFPCVGIDGYTKIRFEAEAAAA